MSRCLLHKSKFGAFKAYVNAHPNLEWRDSFNLGNGYCLAQVRSKSGGWGGHWLGIYVRHHMPEHYTVDVRLEATVRAFIRSTRAPKVTPDTVTVATRTGEPDVRTDPADARPPG